MKETAIYIHIPFCSHKCVYCDFYSVTTLARSSEYLNCLKKEIGYSSKSYSGGREIVSIYFGGGTPSLMDADYIGEIIKTVKDNFNVSSSAEITLETNPGTVNKKKLAGFLNAGINRISIGVQSFNQPELEFLTRIHDSALAEKTVFNALDSGFENISIDLIFNLPSQTREKWSKNLERAISLPVKHISAYSLILEPGTILNKMVLDGKVKMQEEEIDADLYEYTIDFLERHGFLQYEVSNFAQKGYECIHNNIYWHYKDYLSFGTSAHSFAGKKRWWNFTGLTFYLKAMHEKGSAIAGMEQLTSAQMLQEYVMLALRSSGLRISEFINLFGEQWLSENETKIEFFIRKSLMERDQDKLKFTSKGYVLCDEILTQFT